MKKLNVLTLAFITAVTACGPQAPRDVKVSKDLTPLHANVPTNVKAVAPNFVSEKRLTYFISFLSAYSAISLPAKIPPAIPASI